jgi:AcrR family transcriptional regulator
MNTREKIIRTSIELFLKKGFENVSLNHIAEKVGISKPAIYYHYKNKEALIFAIYDYFNEKMKIWSMNYFSGTASPKEYFRKMFEAVVIFANIEEILLDKSNDEFNSSYNSLLISFGRYNPEYKKRMSELTIQTRKQIEKVIKSAQKDKIIKKNINSATLSMLIHSSIEGLSFMHDTDESISIENDSSKVFDLLWKLISE